MMAHLHAIVRLAHYLWWDAKCRLGRALETLQWFIAMLLPRWLVYLATMRLVAHATTGKYGHSNPSKLSAMAAIKRWEIPNE